MAKQEKVYWPEDHETSIQPVEIVDEVRNSMLQYSMSVLVGRALPLPELFRAPQKPILSS